MMMLMRLMNTVWLCSDCTPLRQVYWDLPGAVEETGMASSRGGGRAGNMKFTLQTIHQKVSSAQHPILVSKEGTTVTRVLSPPPSFLAPSGGAHLFSDVRSLLLIFYLLACDNEATLASMPPVLDQLISVHYSSFQSHSLLPLLVTPLVIAPPPSDSPLVMAP